MGIQSEAGFEETPRRRVQVHSGLGTNADPITKEYTEFRMKLGIDNDLNDLEIAVESVIQSFGDLKGALEWVLQPDQTKSAEDHQKISDDPEDARSPFSRRTQRETVRLNSLTARIRDTINQLDLG